MSDVNVHEQIQNFRSMNVFSQNFHCKSLYKVVGPMRYSTEFARAAFDIFMKVEKEGKHKITEITAFFQVKSNLPSVAQRCCVVIGRGNADISMGILLQNYSRKNVVRLRRSLKVLLVTTKQWVPVFGGAGGSLKLTTIFIQLLSKLKYDNLPPRPDAP
jgi:hypothetical protein